MYFTCSSSSVLYYMIDYMPFGKPLHETFEHPFNVQCSYKSSTILCDSNFPCKHHVTVYQWHPVAIDTVLDLNTAVETKPSHQQRHVLQLGTDLQQTVRRDLVVRFLWCWQRTAKKTNRTKSNWQQWPLFLLALWMFEAWNIKKAGIFLQPWISWHGKVAWDTVVTEGAKLLSKEQPCGCWGNIYNCLTTCFFVSESASPLETKTTPLANSCWISQY